MEGVRKEWWRGTGGQRRAEVGLNVITDRGDKALIICDKGRLSVPSPVEGSGL